MASPFGASDFYFPIFNVCHRRESEHAERFDFLLFPFRILDGAVSGAVLA